MAAFVSHECAKKLLFLLVFFFLPIYFDLSLSLSFFDLFSFFVGGFVAHFIVFLLHWIVAGQLFRRETNLIFKGYYGNSKIGSDTFFVSQGNAVRISQNIQNEVSLERSIFADFVAYRFNWKLNGSRKKCIHRSIWVLYDSSRPNRVKGELISFNHTDKCSHSEFKVLTKILFGSLWETNRWCHL